MTSPLCVVIHPQLPMAPQLAHFMHPSTLCISCAPHSGHFLPELGAMCPVVGVALDAL